jgi:phosphopantothenoylcysteine decarboxylase/phosphopantothenate--cysteine ligase
MHEPMYAHPCVLDAIERVGSWGLNFVDPVVEEGKAKMATDEAIVVDTARAVGDGALEGTHVVVTSGATSEPIDPVRTLTNRASGTTGRAVARACYARGAEVTLVHDGPEVPYAAVMHASTGEEMTEDTESACADADVLVSAAAISDFTVEERAEKIRSGQDLTLDLEPTPKLLDTVRETNPDVDLVGFKVETGGDDDALVDAARDHRERVGAAIVVANDASVMGSEETRALLVDDDVETYEGDKAGLGARVADRIAALR